MFDTGVPLRPRGQYLSLEVPGLAEGRPSLLLGDRVVATVAREEEEEERGGGKYWEGYIHEVNPVCKNNFDVEKLVTEVKALKTSMYVLIVFQILRLGCGV